jgi:DNA-binding transcriptional regulator YiaG
MDKIKFWQLQKEASLSNNECAEYLDVTKRSIERWRIDNPPAPRAAILAMQAYNKEEQNEK